MSLWDQPFLAGKKNYIFPSAFSIFRSGFMSNIFSLLTAPPPARRYEENSGSVYIPTLNAVGKHNKNESVSSSN